MTVEYELTADGRRLEPVVAVMKTFGSWLRGANDGACR
ncbi:winged helix-turn-helix transcriptional regulator [Pseudomonas sp. UBA6562]|nr:winged helix-turn-helix transcriptional regulator [Pseudomonas sp. UBA6562]